MAQTPHKRLRPVQSRQNATVKTLRHAFAHGGLTEDGLCAIEGTHLLEEALRTGLKLHTAVFSDHALDIAEHLLPQISLEAETILVPKQVFESISATDAPQGVAA